MGENIADAISIVNDAIGSLVVKSIYHKSSKLEDVKTNSNAVKTIAIVDIIKYRKLNEKTVCKNVSVPEYLVEMGKKEKINFS